MSNNQFRMSVKLTFIVGMFILAGVVIEGGARLAYHIRKDIEPFIHKAAPVGLEEYKMPDPKHPGNWILRPGLSMTLEEAIEMKQRGGRTLASEYLRNAAAKMGYSQSEEIFRINRDGFKGSDIDERHLRTRILTIGDSCTFGSFFDRYSYPRSMERFLLNEKFNVEVINAGVEGYSPSNVLLRIDEFKALKPEITVIYIGWNALYENDPNDGTNSLRSLYLIKKAFSVIRSHITDSQKAALQEYSKAKHPDIKASAVIQLEGYVPLFLNDVELIIQEMKSAGSAVVIMTLPGLFSMEETPTQTALKIGHLPTFTDNPYVLANMSKQYNIALRSLAQRYGLTLIDLETWSNTALQPRDTFFIDSVHLNENAQEKLGNLIAKELIPLLSKNNLRKIN